jgi:hypothetical protein
MVLGHGHGLAVRRAAADDRKTIWRTRAGRQFGEDSGENGGKKDTVKMAGDDVQPFAS